MRVLVVTNDFPPRVGGINDYVHQLVRRLAPGSVTVLTSTYPGAAAFDATFPQRVVRQPVRMLLPTPAVLAAASRLVVAERPDVILFGAAAPLALMGATLRRRHGVPYIACTHGFELVATRLPPGGVFLRRLGRTAAAVTVVSRYVRERLMPFLEGGCRVELLPSGIDATRFHPAVTADDVRRRHALGADPTIVCVSRLVPRKGQDHLIRVLPRLADEFPNVRLLIVGDGRYKRTLRRLTACLGLERRVVFAGEVRYELLPAYFRAADVFAMPCRSRFGGLEVEGLGAVFLQAAAVGRACVAGRSGGAPEAVRHGETGLVVDGTDLDELATALLTLLRDPARAQTMGAAGAAWVHGALTWDHMAVRLRDLLTTCAGVHGGGHT
ncbi:MAG: glycosyltransferase family 4 protein [Acidobacteria bacterium]|nr:glycosyltransferase family 4 protein [Acidobacteriota bacterium]